MPLTLYDMKNLALTPRRAWLRRKDTETDPEMAQLFYNRYYRRPLYDFLNATVRNPDLLIDVPLDESSVVLDVGAYRGQWARKVWKRYEPTIHCFEPAPHPLKRCEAKFGDNPKVHVHPYGLGGATSTEHLSLRGPAASIYDAPSDEYEQVTIEIRDVAAVLEELDLGEVDLLKVNIEGAEFDLFDRLDDTGWMPTMRYVMVQFHEWHPKAYKRRRQVRRALARTHDEVWNYPWVWECWRRKDVPAADQSSSRG